MIWNIWKYDFVKDMDCTHLVKSTFNWSVRSLLSVAGFLPVVGLLMFFGNSVGVEAFRAGQSGSPSSDA